jgi:DNA-binding response OmpR family regulator
MKDNECPQTESPAGATIQCSANPPRRILVVEDDSVLRKFNAEFLISSGYAVDVAEDGAAAWDALQANRYDLLITDNSMPKMSGMELLKKARSARMGLPVIMATGTLPTRELAQNPGLDPVTTLEKPYDLEQLLEAVKAVLPTEFVKSDAPRAAPKHNDDGTVEGVFHTL